MWQKYKSAIITGVVLCCIIFFGLGYCVGSSGKGYHGGIQPTEFQGAQNGDNRMGPGGRHNGYPPNTTAPQNPTENEDQNTDENQQTPPNTNDNTGSQDGTVNATSYLYGEVFVF